MLSCVIDAIESRDVATVDIPGVFMHADMDEKVFMKLEGKMAELLIQLYPDQYAKYMTTENGKRMLYVKLKKALYGTLKAAILFWKHLSGKLQGKVLFRICMTHAWLIRILMDHSAPFSGMWMTSRSHM